MSRPSRFGDDVQSVARQVFGWKRLRPQQLAAMEAILSGRDVLAVMPTGSGKSAIYQVPAVLIDGPTLVISPLIALQQDQIAQLEATGALEAVAINSRQRAAEEQKSWTAVRHHEAEYVFLAPEQLDKEDVVAELRRVGVSLIVVDEAHCVSAWGHDFRPSYLRVTDVIDGLSSGGRPPVVALTATASPVVRREIVERLGLRDPVVIAGGFDRPNIRLEVEHHLADDDKRDAVLAAVQGLSGRGLLYTATRKDAEFYAHELTERGMRAAAYHAGLTAAQRDEVHRRFHDDDYDVVAATSAFGMGIDKPNVRFVVHASVPDSVDTYYQQIGRAGRDGKPTLARLFYRPEDLSLARFFATHRPDEDLLREVYAALRGGPPKRLKDLDSTLGVSGRRLTNAVNLLEQAKAVTATRKGFVATDADPAEAVRRALDIAEAAERVDRTRVEMMRGYAEERNCRRQFLLSYFGETLTQPCGNCDRCSAGGDAATSARDEVAGYAVDAHVEHRTWGHGVVISAESDRITVLFDDFGYRTLSVDAISGTDILRRD